MIMHGHIMQITLKILTWALWDNIFFSSHKILCMKAGNSVFKNLCQKKIYKGYHCVYNYFSFDISYIFFVSMEQKKTHTTSLRCAHCTQRGWLHPRIHAEPCDGEVWRERFLAAPNQVPLHVRRRRHLLPFWRSNVQVKTGLLDLQRLSGKLKKKILITHDNPIFTICMVKTIHVISAVSKISARFF